jgi:hypothetical protein
MFMLRNTAVVAVSSVALLLGVGCAGERHDEIPPSARLMVKDSGNVSFAAPDDGEVYVYNRANGNLLYSGRVRQGENLSVNAMEDEIRLNGRVVRDQQIRDNDELRVFFRPEPQADVAGARMRGQRTQTAEQRSSSDAEITVQPREDSSEIRVRPGSDADAKVTVEPTRDGQQKVTIEREAK